MDPSIPQNLDEYSASATTITFNSPIPLLRGPIPAGPRDDPSSGSYLLAFKDPQSWATAFSSCKAKILAQCEEGARIGCAISASKKCKPPWWHNLIGWKPMDLKERERCEDRELEGCLVAAEEKCIGFAKERCMRPFLDARIAMGEREIRKKVVRKLVCLASMPGESTWRDVIGLDQLGKCELGITNYTGSELLSSSSQFECLFK
ncbi:hypothetical protein SLE2022_145800 [Rubroshorea leprosula]|uniref:Uncharacterized protein n=1 Tax=Rubroshorea leprosula TaxID=152421 RepID=A0AAV5KII8_9ROSI|nr:hypothetical protein SLEP1_g33973 [Rubroshorea leprosula]